MFYIEHCRKYGMQLFMVLDTNITIMKWREAHCEFEVSIFYQLTTNGIEIVDIEIHHINFYHGVYTIPATWLKDSGWYSFAKEIVVYKEIINDRRLHKILLLHIQDSLL